MVGAVYALYRKYKSSWLKDFLDDDWLDAYGASRRRTASRCSG